MAPGAVTTGTPLRAFVPPDALRSGHLELAGAEAARLWDRGARVGDTIVVLDNSGWAWAVAVEICGGNTCAGRVLGRSLAPEPRTKVTLCQGVLQPVDYRRLLVAATRAGVVEIVPVVSDGSPISALGPPSAPDEPAALADLVRDVAERCGRGRTPSLSPPLLFDDALDHVARGGDALVLAPAGEPPAAALVGRPFSIGLFCPPSGGFSAAELQRARGRGARVVAAARAADPVLAAVAALQTVFAALETAGDT